MITPPFKSLPPLALSLLFLGVTLASLPGCGGDLSCGEGTVDLEGRCVLAEDACGEGTTLRDGRCVVADPDEEPDPDPDPDPDPPEDPEDPWPELPDQGCGADGEVMESQEACGVNGSGRWLFECVDGAWELLYCDAIRSWSVNEQTACFIDGLGDLYCWGGDFCGQMGLGAEWFDQGQWPSSYPTPTRIDTLPSDLLDVHHVADSRCVLAADGQVYCSGHRMLGVIGDGADKVPSTETVFCPTLDTMAELPVAVPGLSQVQELVSGTNGYCARQSNNAVACWGNLYNVYEDGGFVASPTQITGLPGTLDGLYAGYSHFCATSAGDLYCWGWGATGVLGTNDSVSRLNARQVSLPSPVVDVALAGHACALLENGELYCWGSNIGGRLGLGDDSQGNFLTPQLVGSFPGARLDHKSGTCLVDADDQAYCWGTNNRAQSGITPTVPGPDLNLGTERSPVAVDGGFSFRHVTRQQFWRSCGITHDWQLACWGVNDSGELARGIISDYELPGTVSGSRTFSRVNVDGQHLTLALSRDGYVYAAGRTYGEHPTRMVQVMERVE